MKNLLETTVQQEIIARIDKLTPSHKAVWGKMNVHQGLRHLNMGLKIPIGELDPTPVNPPKMPKWLLKFFLVNVKPPKNAADTFSEMNMVSNNIFPTDLDVEKKDLKDTLVKFTSAQKYIPENKLAGKFCSKDWGKLNYNHLDHHLRQFGV